MTASHNRYLFSPALRLGAALLLCAQLATSFANDWQFSGIDRVVAVSDIHGAYDAMVATLTAAGVIDENRAWSGDKTHLVITGDLLDRGPDSRRVMDLIMRLEVEAQAAGGRVHQLIGNHEVMNLVGDLRYVAKREYAAFSEDESEQERLHWLQRFRTMQPAYAGQETVLAAFNELAPPGFFAHRRAFRADGYYGKWLLEKPLMVVIDGTAFVHGGVSPYVAEHGLAGVNGTLKAGLIDYVTELGVLVDRGLLSPTDSFYDHPELLKAAIENGSLKGDAKASAKLLIDLNASPIHGPDSPLWYRGSVGCSELIEGDALNAALSKIGASRVVIGHTPTITRQILQRLNGRVIEIDTGILKAAYKGSGNALVIEGDTLTVINQGGQTTSPPLEHPRRVGWRSELVNADDLTDMLSYAAIATSNIDRSGQKLVHFTIDGNTLSARFDQKPRKKGFLPELAAYRLDRLLGLDMVPVTVRREIDGKDGTLQFLPALTQSEQERSASGRGHSAWCSLPKQWNTMYIFDALTSNVGRNPAMMLYSKDNWQLMLLKNGRSFSTSKDRPPYLKNIEFDVTDSWIDTLRGLSDDVLKEQLGDVLNKRQLAALGKRRDRLIRDAED